MPINKKTHKMKKFNLYQNCVNIIDDNGTLKRIFFDEDSGKVYWRYKIPNLVGTKHSGIYLGTDLYGTEYYLHNHYHIGNACLVTADKFSEGQPLGIYDAKCTNPAITVIEIALKQAVKKEAYHFLNYNCQGYTNEACHNHRKSEDVGKWGKRLVFGSLIAIGLSIAFSKE